MIKKSQQCNIVFLICIHFMKMYKRLIVLKWYFPNYLLFHHRRTSINGCLVDWDINTFQNV